MSELINSNDNHATIRRKLLTGASALALTAYVSSAGMAYADDSGNPQLWITLGGELSMLQGGATSFTAPFMTALSPVPDNYRNNAFDQNRAKYVLGADGKISFQPDGSDWIFSAGIRYGRSHSKRHVHNQTQLGTFHLTTSFIYSGVPLTFHLQYKPAVARFTDVKAPSGEKHTIVDFSAGKDVGLGFLGTESSSMVSAGVRSADFSSDGSLDVQARPLVTPLYRPYYFKSNFPKYLTWDQYAMTGRAERSFKGIGPTISWDASAAIAGNPEHGQLTLDWGIDIAALFGRQKAKVEHATQASSYRDKLAGGAYLHIHQLYHHPASAPAYHSTRSRMVTVPELSGFIGLSARYTDMKVSVGYKGDIWFNAMDTGIDARKTSNLTFNGPYASISIGLGD